MTNKSVLFKAKIKIVHSTTSGYKAESNFQSSITGNKEEREKDSKRVLLEAITELALILNTYGVDEAEIIKAASGE